MSNSNYQFGLNLAVYQRPTETPEQAIERGQSIVDNWSRTDRVRVWVHGLRRHRRGLARVIAELRSA